MLREWIGILMTLECVGVQLCAAAQPIDKAATTPTELLDEVVVRGTRLSELKAAIVEAEDRFYARYNELNNVDVFDIVCTIDSPTGTKINQRVCLTKLQLNAKRDYAREYLQNLQDTTKYAGESPGPGKPPDTNPNAVWSVRYEEYRDNMLYLLSRHPDLRRLASEGEEAQKRFDAEYKRQLKGRLILVR
jgi:hypothetical protein